jgi:hypothetical protein
LEASLLQGDVTAVNAARLLIDTHLAPKREVSPGQPSDDDK